VSAAAILLGVQRLLRRLVRVVYMTAAFRKQEKKKSGRVVSIGVLFPPFPLVDAIGIV
jgi:hypothetical protein